MSNEPKQAGDKKPGDNRPEDPSHPGMNPDPAERGRELGHENADGGHCVGTGGHGTGSGGGCSNQPVGGNHVSDPSKFSQKELHPGMNPDPAERGRELGHENADGGHCVGTGGHGTSSGGGCSHQPVGGNHVSDPSKCSQKELHPGMNPDPAKRGRELGHENADGEHCVGTGGHGTGSGGGCSYQPVGGNHVLDPSKCSQKELHPGMNPDPAERGRELGHENAEGGHCIGTGGHGAGSGVGCSNQPVGGNHVSDPSKFSQKELHPGMNPNPAERGRQLGRENAEGGHCVGTGGHETSGVNLGK